jgi:hypothetical protein
MVRSVCIWFACAGLSEPQRSPLAARVLSVFGSLGLLNINNTTDTNENNTPPPYTYMYGAAAQPSQANQNPLPAEQAEHFSVVRLFFPCKPQANQVTRLPSVYEANGRFSVANQSGSGPAALRAALYALPMAAGLPTYPPASAAPP